MAQSSSRGRSGGADQPKVEEEQVVSVNQGADVFVESITYGETLTYVKNVLGNYAAYRSLYRD